MFATSLLVITQAHCQLTTRFSLLFREFFVAVMLLLVVVVVVNALIFVRR